MIAYKGTNNFKGINITYEIGKTYTFDGEIRKQIRGFHFSKDIDNVNMFYPLNEKDTKVLKIEVLVTPNWFYNDEIIGCTDKFKVIREIEKKEYNLLSKLLRFNKKGQILSDIKEDGSRKIFKYDEKNRLLSVSHFDNEANLLIKERFNTYGNLIRKRTYNDKNEQYAYLSDVNGSHKICFYSCYYQTGKEILVDYSYDKDGNLIKENHYGSTNPHEKTFEYKNGLCIMEKGPDRLVKTEYKNNKPIRIEKTEDGITDIVTMEYNPSGLITYFKSNCSEVIYKYNEKNELIFKSMDDGDWEEFGYDDKGNQIDYKSKHVNYSIIIE